MKRVRHILGFDPAKGWYYRDLGLATIASIALVWAVVALAFGTGDFDFRLGALSIGVVLACCLLSPNWHLILGAAVGFAAVQSWLAVLFSSERRSWWVAVPATILLAALMKIASTRPVRARWGAPRPEK